MSEMNSRERYLATMSFQPDVRPPIWEFAYWNATAERWYAEGLPRSPWSLPPGHPNGGTLCAEGLPWQYLTCSTFCKEKGHGTRSITSRIQSLR